MSVCLSMSNMSWEETFIMFNRSFKNIVYWCKCPMYMLSSCWFSDVINGSISLSIDVVWASSGLWQVLGMYLQTHFFLFWLLTVGNVFWVSLSKKKKIEIFGWVEWPVGQSENIHGSRSHNLPDTGRTL